MPSQLFLRLPSELLRTPHRRISPPSPDSQSATSSPQSSTPSCTFDDEQHHEQAPQEAHQQRRRRIEGETDWDCRLSLFQFVILGTRISL